MVKKIDFRDYRQNTFTNQMLQFEDLQREYFALCDRLDRDLPDASFKTIYENVFSRKLVQVTKLEYRRSFWIGRYNADFFFPALKLVIEIDGKVHDQEFRGNQDQSKIFFFQKLGIAVASIENHDFNEQTVKSILQGMDSIPRLDSRGRQRLLRNIYLTTLAHHLKDNYLSEAFGSENLDVFSFVRRRL